MENNPSYYAIIPANVRYSTKLKANEKLLYGEITALSQKDGRCYASNRYFAKLYQVSTVTVSGWISNLAANGFVKSELVYRKGSKEILKRYISILNGGIKENLNRGIKENLKDNNTSLNTTSLNKDILTLKTFETFWNTYHYLINLAKTDKDPALSIWRKLTIKERDKAQQSIKPYSNTQTKQDHKYLKKARTYLRDKTFNDEFKSVKLITSAYVAP